MTSIQNFLKFALWALLVCRYGSRGCNTIMQCSKITFTVLPAAKIKLLKKNVPLLVIIGWRKKCPPEKLPDVHNYASDGGGGEQDTLICVHELPNCAPDEG